MAKKPPRVKGQPFVASTLPSSKNGAKDNPDGEMLILGVQLCSMSSMTGYSKKVIFYPSACFTGYILRVATLSRNFQLVSETVSKKSMFNPEQPNLMTLGS